jgi:uncharacterized protein (DUF488 family)
MSASTLHTVGHSTRTIGDFIDLLREAGIRRLVDVRRYPGSRRYPHFSREPLRDAVEAGKMSYRHDAALGGRREPAADSPNTAWRNAGFRGYADHLASAAFAEALERLEADAGAEPTAVMCAEALPWRCHRRLIADVWVALGGEVVHLLGSGEQTLHELNERARMGVDGVLRYPSPLDPQGGLL